MGMDITGRNPNNPVGKYFRANLWSWRPIHRLCVELCSDLLNKAMLSGMEFNDGAGPADQETCTQMATRFDRWMEHHTSGLKLDSNLRVDKEGRFLSEQELAENPDIETESAYDVDDEHLKKWVEFLRHCGGFEVW